MHTYIKSEENLWTVGHYVTDISHYNRVRWHSMKDFSREKDAAAFVSYLNGNNELTLSEKGWHDAGF